MRPRTESRACWVLLFPSPFLMLQLRPFYFLRRSSVISLSSGVSAFARHDSISSSCPSICLTSPLRTSGSRVRCHGCISWTRSLLIVLFSRSHCRRILNDGRSSNPGILGPTAWRMSVESSARKVGWRAGRPCQEGQSLCGELSGYLQRSLDASNQEVDRNTPLPGTPTKTTGNGEDRATKPPTQKQTERFAEER